MIPIKDTVLRREFPWMTWVIILLNSLVFLFETSLPADILERLIYTFGVVPAQLSGQESGLAHPASYLPPDDKHVPARWLAPHHRQHVVSVSLRRQRGRKHWACKVLFFLHALWHQCRPDLHFLRSSISSTLDRSVWSDLRDHGSLYCDVSKGPGPDLGPGCDHSIFFSFTRVFISRILVFDSDFFGDLFPPIASNARRSRMVGSHRRIYNRDHSPPTVQGKGKEGPSGG